MTYPAPQVTIVGLFDAQGNSISGGTNGGGLSVSLDDATKAELAQIAGSIITSGTNKQVAITDALSVLSNDTCKQLTISNNTGVVVNVVQDSNTFPVFPGTYFTFMGLTSAGELSVQRADGITTSVTLNYRIEG